MSADSTPYLIKIFYDERWNEELLTKIIIFVVEHDSKTNKQSDDPESTLEDPSIEMALHIHILEPILQSLDETPILFLILVESFTISEGVQVAVIHYVIHKHWFVKCFSPDEET